MTYWDGNRWIPEGPPQPREPRRRAGRRLLGASTEAALITLLMFGLIAGTTLAAKGGNGSNPQPNREHMHGGWQRRHRHGLPTTRCSTSW